MLYILILFLMISNVESKVWQPSNYYPDFFSWLTTTPIPMQHKKRPGMYPYLSGDTFRIICNHICDETDFYFNPENVLRGDTIFVNTHFIEYFFKTIHPLINNKYILVTHNEDISAPGKFKSYLEDEKIFAWFGQNCDIENHPKLIPIPIGLENKHWERHYDILISDLCSKNLDKRQRDCLLYSNFNVDTNPKIRKPVLEYFNNKNFCYTIHSKKGYLDYLIDVCNSKFILSPQGNGLDCHRTWEALYLGAIPIVKKSSIDALFENLPVLIIDDWNQVTEDFLQNKYNEIKSKAYKLEKLHFDYWKNLIHQYQTHCKFN